MLRNLIPGFGVVVVFSFLIMGCSEQVEAERSQNEGDKSVDMVADNGELKSNKFEEGKKDNLSSPVPESQLKQQPGEQIYLIINGNKFEASSTTLIKDDIVTDLSMYEKARATGNLVVVLSEESVDLTGLKKNYKLRPIAKSTFLITPIQTSNLLLNYKQLKQLPGVERVEIQLDYSPVDSGPATH